MNDSVNTPPMSRRFRGFLPVVVDIESAGFNCDTDALLEIAAVLLKMDDNGMLTRDATHAFHVKPFPNSRLDPKSLEFTGIDPFHPFRMAVDEKVALEKMFESIQIAVKEQACTRAVLVGHNPAFDLSFLGAAVHRTKIKQNPFHKFTTFDTATLAGVAYGQTVLSRAVQAAGIAWDNEKAHSAIYDAERTADLFCSIVNKWNGISGIPSPSAGEQGEGG